eukprot:scaffold1928_cov381-Prasinococcus_capsulatus_cf.AAC.13
MDAVRWWRRGPAPPRPPRVRTPGHCYAYPRGAKSKPQAWGPAAAADADHHHKQQQQLQQQQLVRRRGFVSLVGGLAGRPAHDRQGSAVPSPRCARPRAPPWPCSLLSAGLRGGVPSGKAIPPVLREGPRSGAQPLPHARRAHT